MAPCSVLLALFSLWQCRGKGNAGPVKRGRAERIVSMVPSATETLFELGVGGRVIAVCDQCRWPEAAARLPKVGSYLNPSTETILKLEPDLVLLYETQGQLRAALESRGIPVLAVLTENLEDLYGSIEKIGAAVGRGPRAAELVAGIRAEMGEIEARLKLAGREKVRTVVVVDRMPAALQRIFVAAGGSYVGQLVAAAGGDNCFKDMKERYPMVSFEAIAACRPEVVIDIRPASGLSEVNRKNAETLWKQSGIVCPEGTVKKIAVIGPDPVTVPGPRAGESVAILYGLIRHE
jgi:iron complex transport system substrate-binding protein